MSFTRFSSACLLAALLALPAAASSTAIDIPDASALDVVSVENAVWGWEFSPTVGMSVTELGIYDHLSDGLSDIHTIAIWNVSDESVLTQQLFAPGSGATLSNGFRYIDIVPVDLVAGEKYVIGVLYVTGGSDPVAVASFPDLYESDPFIDVLGGRRTVAGFGFPGETPDEIAFGPNFRFTPVPLPAAVWLMAGALAGLGALSRRRAG